jgi:hypothetical protein
MSGSGIPGDFQGYTAEAPRETPTICRSFELPPRANLPTAVPAASRTQCSDNTTMTNQEAAQHLNGHPVVNDDRLGEPLTIKQVARVIGCSPWSIRQRYLGRGLPHFRLEPKGKLIFYRNQVVQWLLRQQKGGTDE